MDIWIDPCSNGFPLHVFCSWILSQTLCCSIHKQIHFLSFLQDHQHLNIISKKRRRISQTEIYIYFKKSLIALAMTHVMLYFAPVKHFIAERTSILAQLLVSLPHMPSAVWLVREQLTAELTWEALVCWQDKIAHRSCVDCYHTTHESVQRVS